MTLSICSISHQLCRQAWNGFLPKKGLRCQWFHIFPSTNNVSIVILVFFLKKSERLQHYDFFSSKKSERCQHSVFSLHEQKARKVRWWATNTCHHCPWSLPLQGRCIHRIHRQCIHSIHSGSVSTEAFNYSTEPAIRVHVNAFHSGVFSKVLQCVELVNCNLLHVHTPTRSTTFRHCWLFWVDVTNSVKSFLV